MGRIEDFIKSDERYLLINDDCFNVLTGIPQVALIATDIPYNEVNRKTNGLRNIDKSIADSDFVDIPLLCKLFSNISKSCYIFCGTEQVSSLRQEFVKYHMSTRQCVWEKTNPSPLNCQYLWLSSVELCIYAKSKGGIFNGFYESPVWRGPSERVEGFPCPKPIWLCKLIIDASSNIGDIIIDPFMGSGSFIIAGLQLGRRVVGIEKNTTYFNLVRKRVATTI